jgi:hypothetical protein
MSNNQGSGSDKSYVTIELCPICGGDTGALLMNKRLHKTFGKQTVNPRTTCGECKEKYLKLGVMLINPETGSLAVLKDEAFVRLFNTPVPAGKIAFAAESVVQQLIASQSAPQQSVGAEAAA